MEEYSGFGRPKIYVDKVNYKNIPEQFMVEGIICDKEITRIYQINVLNRSFDDKLNVVIIQKIIGEKIAQVIFFSTDLELNYKKMIEYYSSRFQIEFNFRDAKKFWGLEDFMVTELVEV